MKQRKMLVRGLLVVALLAGFFMASAYGVENEEGAGIDDACVTNLKHISLSLQIYAEEHNKKLPSDLKELYPRYIDAPTIFWCPGDRDPKPTDITNADLNALNSSQISYKYYPGYSIDSPHPSGIIIAEDNSFDNHKGGKCVLYLDGHLICKSKEMKKAPDSEVDLSNITDTGEKTRRILKEFEGMNCYTSSNPLVEQIVELEEEAIQPLLDELEEPEEWPKQLAIEEALNELLKEKHKEIILKVFQEKDICVKLIKKYKFPEAEDMVMDKIQAVTKENGYADEDLIDAALSFNKERAIPLLVDYVSLNRQPVYAAQKLAEIPGVDITEPMREAARNVEAPWSEGGLAELMIERGMKEGLDLAIRVLKSAEDCEYVKKDISKTLRAYTDAGGDYDEMAAWLEKNKNSLVWNKKYRRFEL